jgi:DNA polymerase/3'-5' exonuclease PolX
MLLDEGKLIANEVLGWLRPGCERVEVAGSIRRGKAEVKDVELVLIPAMAERQVTLFDWGLVSLLDGCLEAVLGMGLLRFDEVVKRNGPKYKRLIHVTSGAVVELFAAKEDNWGLVLALRTGPREFNRLLVTQRWLGGAMPAGMRMRGGWLWQGEQCLATPTEEEFFQVVGVPCWLPADRTVERLREYLEIRWR